MLIITSLAYILSFIAIWFGAGLIIQSVDGLARRLRMSSFAVSFFVLGLLTSIPETAVSYNAIANHKPEIFVGTLLGGTIVIFLFIIPVLAILGRGVKINHDLNTRNLLFALAVIAAPGLFAIDHRVTNLEGIILVILYIVLFFAVEKNHGILEKQQSEVLAVKVYSFVDVVKVILGIGIVFVSSQYIVGQTVVFAELFRVPAFYISLLILGLGTNLPELSLAIRAVLSGKKDIAFGDYMGSTAANALLFGVFTLANNGEILTTNHFGMTFLFTVIGLILFYNFSQSHRDISVKEGIVLFGIYVTFVGYELVKGILF